MSASIWWSSQAPPICILVEYRRGKFARERSQQLGARDDVGEYPDQKEVLRNCQYIGL